MAEDINEFQVIVKLNFVDRITDKLEDAVFESFELGDIRCSSLIQSFGEEVSISVYCQNMTQDQALLKIKEKLLGVMFNISVEEIE